MFLDPVLDFLSREHVGKAGKDVTSHWNDIAPLGDFGDAEVPRFEIEAWKVAWPLRGQRPR